MSQSQGTSDEVLEQVREVRESYGARFDYDIAALFRHARKLTTQTDRVVIKRQPKPADITAEASQRYGS